MQRIKNGLVQFWWLPLAFMLGASFAWRQFRTALDDEFWTELDDEYYLMVCYRYVRRMHPVLFRACDWTEIGGEPAGVAF